MIGLAYILWYEELEWKISKTLNDLKVVSDDDKVFVYVTYKILFNQIQNINE